MINFGLASVGNRYDKSHTAWMIHKFLKKLKELLGYCLWGADQNIEKAVQKYMLRRKFIVGNYVPKHKLLNFLTSFLELFFSPRKGLHILWKTGYSSDIQLRQARQFFWSCIFESFTIINWTNNQTNFMNIYIYLHIW